MNFTNSLYTTTNYDIQSDAQKESEFLFHEFAQIFDSSSSIFNDVIYQENFKVKFNDVIGILDTQSIIKEEMKKESSLYEYSSKKTKLN